MFQEMLSSRMALAAAGMLMLFGSTVKADEAKCRATIIKESAKWETAKLKTLTKCHDALLKAKLAPGKNCIPGDANLDAKTGDTLSKALAKYSGKIAKDCKDADIALVFPSGECPRFSTADEAAVCSAAVTNAAEAAACLQCLGEASVDSLINLAYGTLIPNPAATVDKDLQKCQRSIGKNLEKYFKAARKTLAKCEGKGSPCPTDPKIGDARTKLLDAIDKDCGKKKDLNQDDIGGPCSCPGLITPTGATNCAQSIHTRGDLADCVACVVDHKAPCLTDLSTNPETNDQDCQPICGNGAVDSGETCDDGNADDFDACPSDCNISPCVNPSGSVTATINLAGPAAAASGDLSALTVFVKYPDGKVRIVGSGGSTNQAQFTATNGTADLAANDVDYGARIVETDPFFDLGNPPLQITFDKCNGATPADAEFDCWVEFAADTSANILSGVTCSVDVP